jgi:hypothetical protein
MDSAVRHRSDGLIDFVSPKAEIANPFCEGTSEDSLEIVEQCDAILSKSFRPTE